MLSYDELAKIQKDHDCDLFPYVGLITENKKVLSDLHKDYPKWLDEQSKKKAAAASAAKSAAPGGGGDSDWMSIFDAGDEAIQQSKKR